nr:MAG TPA: hypothetical protein [Caudoviricetes sp.]
MSSIYNILYTTATYINIIFNKLMCSRVHSNKTKSHNPCYSQGLWLLLYYTYLFFMNIIVSKTYQSGIKKTSFMLYIRLFFYSHS